ncbi:MAG: hypothetical protein IJ309_03415 [Clostridia bacterium]|nr:hypothetical protein [Clostridia bacterium]
MKNKLLIIAILATLCMLTFTLAVSAEEYRVSTKADYDSAYSQTVDGDTIVITADISTKFDFGKTITYILDGGERWTANAGYENGVESTTASATKLSR